MMLYSPDTKLNSGVLSTSTSSCCLSNAFHKILEDEIQSDEKGHMDSPASPKTVLMRKQCLRYQSEELYREEAMQNRSIKQTREHRKEERREHRDETAASTKIFEIPCTESVVERSFDEAFDLTTNYTMRYTGVSVVTPTNPPTKETRREETRRVRFSPECAVVHPILLRKEYTKEEEKATWYQTEEYASITKNCCKEIRLIAKGTVLRDKKYCARGLESHTWKVSIAKEKIRNEALVAVLDEQYRQWAQGKQIPDEETIAHLYSSFSSSAQLWATRVALLDQRAAENIFDDEY